MPSYFTFVLEDICMHVLHLATSLALYFIQQYCFFPLNRVIVSLDFCDCLISLLIIGLLLLLWNSF